MSMTTPNRLWIIGVPHHDPINCRLAVSRKGGKVVIIPLAPGTARAVDLAIGESGPLLG
jgi:hypothetical protein